MKSLTVATIVLGMLALNACSNRQVYETIQNNQRLECDKLPDSAQRDACLQQYSESYDSYKRSRDELLNKKK